MSSMKFVGTSVVDIPDWDPSMLEVPKYSGKWGDALDEDDQSPVAAAPAARREGEEEAAVDVPGTRDVADGTAKGDLHEPTSTMSTQSGFVPCFGRSPDSWQTPLIDQASPPYDASRLDASSPVAEDEAGEEEGEDDDNWDEADDPATPLMTLGQPAGPPGGGAEVFRRHLGFIRDAEQTRSLQAKGILVQSFIENEDTVVEVICPDESEVTDLTSPSSFDDTDLDIERQRRSAERAARKAAQVASKDGVCKEQAGPRSEKFTRLRAWPEDSPSKSKSKDKDKEKDTVQDKEMEKDKDNHNEKKLANGDDARKSRGHQPPPEPEEAEPYTGNIEERFQQALQRQRERRAARRVSEQEAAQPQERSRRAGAGGPPTRRSRSLQRDEEVYGDEGRSWEEVPRASRRTRSQGREAEDAQYARGGYAYSEEWEPHDAQPRRLRFDGGEGTSQKHARAQRPDRPLFEGKRGERMRENRNGQDGREDRNGYDGRDRERRSGYDDGDYGYNDRESRHKHEDRERRGGYDDGDHGYNGRERRHKHENRERRGGYDDDDYGYDHRDNRNGYEERERRRGKYDDDEYGYGARGTRTGYDERERRRSYDDSENYYDTRESRQAYDERERRRGYGDNGHGYDGRESREDYEERERRGAKDTQRQSKTQDYDWWASRAPSDDKPWSQGWHTNGDRWRDKQPAAKPRSRREQQHGGGYDQNWQPGTSAGHWNKESSNAWQNGWDD